MILYCLTLEKILILNHIKKIVGNPLLHVSAPDLEIHRSSTQSKPSQYPHFFYLPLPSRKKDRPHRLDSHRPYHLLFLLYYCMIAEYLLKILTSKAIFQFSDLRTLWHLKFNVRYIPQRQFCLPK